jgi:FtsP/CotA-like multicopper oxidase with cupredoxin domain
MTDHGDLDRLPDIGRRKFLAGAATALTLAGTRSRAAAEELRAAPATVQLAPEGRPATPVWAYGGSLPGPTLRLRQGERLTRRFVNGLPQASTVHWHGVRLPNAVDGVPGLTQESVQPGGEFLYEFVAPDAGTYWYHSHDRSWEQVARGLAGPLIVEEADRPETDRDETLVLDDWRLTHDASIDESFGDMHDAAHAGRIGNWITVNGDGAWTRPARRGERMRLRMINAATARIFRIGLQGLEGWIVALDGMPLDAPAPADRLALAPAQRADLVVDVIAAQGGEAFLISFERDGGYAVATFRADGEARAHRLPPPAPLPRNSTPPLEDLARARKARLVMEGGAMGRMPAAMLGDSRLDARALAAKGKFWALNGLADMPAAPLLEAGAGETVRLTMVNDTAWPHAMHLHGHHFRAIGPEGPGPLRDTLLVECGETDEIAFVADNPGDWMLHCHMLAHSYAGMMTWLRVT